MLISNSARTTHGLATIAAWFLLMFPTVAYGQTQELDIPWQKCQQNPLKLEVELKINGQPFRGVLSSANSSTSAPSKFHLKGLQSICIPKLALEFKGITIQSQKGENAPDEVELGMDVLRSFVLLVDHAKRFTLVPASAWAKVKEQEAWRESSVIQLGYDVVDRLFFRTQINGVEVLSLFDTETEQCCIPDPIAKACGLSNQVAAKIIFASRTEECHVVKECPVAIFTGLQRENLPVYVFREGLIPLEKPIQGLIGPGAFKNHLTAFNFATGELIMLNQ